MSILTTTIGYSGDFNPSLSNKFLASNCNGAGPRTNDVAVGLL